MTHPLPDALEVSHNRAALRFVAQRSAHSDIAEVLGRLAGRYADVETFCPDPARYQYVLAYVSNCVFAFAAGMSLIYLRIDAPWRERALEEGAASEPVPGGDWVYFKLWQAGEERPDLEPFFKAAYDYATRSDSER